MFLWTCSTSLGSSCDVLTILRRLSLASIRSFTYGHLFSGIAVLLSMSETRKMSKIRLFWDCSLALSTLLQIPHPPTNGHKIKDWKKITESAFRLPLRLYKGIQSPGTTWRNLSGDSWIPGKKEQKNGRKKFQPDSHFTEAGGHIHEQIFLVHPINSNFSTAWRGFIVKRHTIVLFPITRM